MELSAWTLQCWRQIGVKKVSVITELRMVLTIHWKERMLWGLLCYLDFASCSLTSVINDRHAWLPCSFKGPLCTRTMVL